MNSLILFGRGREIGIMGRCGTHSDRLMVIVVRTMRRYLIRTMRYMIRTMRGIAMTLRNGMLKVRIGMLRVRIGSHVDVCPVPVWRIEVWRLPTPFGVNSCFGRSRLLSFGRPRLPRPILLFHCLGWKVGLAKGIDLVLLWNGESTDNALVDRHLF